MGKFMKANQYKLSKIPEITEESQKNFDELDKSLFNEKQLSQIEIGYKRSLDFLRYADPKYDHSQMFELRIALQYKEYINDEDLDFLFDEKWNNEQMRELRLAMISKVDYHIFADVNYTSTQMRNVRIDLEEAES